MKKAIRSILDEVKTPVQWGLPWLLNYCSPGREAITVIEKE
jgi:hypothetical protein